jgi:uncharacterized YccA/Bax inhibitor family protein
MIPEVTVSDLLTLVGLVPIVMVFVELVKRTFALTTEAIKRFGPLISVVSGIALGLLAGGWLYTQGQTIDWGQAVLTGFVAGALSAGLYDVVGEQLGNIVERATGGRVT